MEHCHGTRERSFPVFVWLGSDGEELYVWPQGRMVMVVVCLAVVRRNHHPWSPCHHSYEQMLTELRVKLQQAEMQSANSSPSSQVSSSLSDAAAAGLAAHLDKVCTSEHTFVLRRAATLTQITCTKVGVGADLCLGGALRAGS